MTVITLSREHHAGGEEIADALSRKLGWQVLDRELVHRAAAIEHVPDEQLERIDEQALSLLDRLMLDPPVESYLHGLRAAARQAMAKGNVILMGRGMHLLLGDSPNCLHVKVTAPFDWRVARAAAQSGVSIDAAHRDCAQVDDRRDRFRRYLFGRVANQPANFDVIVNTSRVAVDQATDLIAALARADWSGPLPAPAAPRLLTLTHQLGAGENYWPAKLADRLGLRLVDRSLLEQLAKDLDRTVPQIEQLDEQPGGIFQRMFSGNIHHRYFKALERRVHEEAARGQVLLVNRGASCFLAEEPAACHAFLMAAPDRRLLSLMRDRWLNAEVAQEMLVDNDAQRRRFHAVYFHKDWTEPLNYHVSLNAGRLGAATLDAVAKVVASRA